MALKHVLVLIQVGEAFTPKMLTHFWGPRIAPPIALHTKENWFRAKEFVLA